MNTVRKLKEIRNLIILGSGRSGTSMVAGTLAQSGYFMGNNLLPANDSNPKGFFEDVSVNRLNEDILDKFTPSPSARFDGLFQRYVPPFNRRWLLLRKGPIQGVAKPGIAERISAFVNSEPFCFKDPRFSYTLPIWRPFLRNTRFIVVFRDPWQTARSIVKECTTDERLHSLNMTMRLAMRVWNSMYKSILSMAENNSDWLFLHYDQVLTEAGLERISSFTGAEVDRDFPERSLNRTPKAAHFFYRPGQVYRNLCLAADFGS